MSMNNPTSIAEQLFFMTVRIDTIEKKNGKAWTGTGFIIHHAVKDNQVAPFVIAAAGPDTSICFGDSATLQGSGGNNFTWIPSTGLSDSTIANPKASPAVSTTYNDTSLIALEDVGRARVAAGIVIMVSPYNGTVAGDSDGRAKPVSCRGVRRRKLDHLSPVVNAAVIAFRRAM